jgi:DNA gyrase subunit A
VRSGSGRPIVPVGAGDALVAAYAGVAPYYLLVTERGAIKRIPAKTVEGAHPAGITCCRVPAGDRVVAVVAHGEDDDILIAKALGQVLRIETGSKLRPVATAAAGTVAGVKVDSDDRVVSALVAEGTSVLSLHDSGRALRVPLDDYPIKGRATAGVQSVLTDRPARDPAGPLALVAALASRSSVTVFTDKGSYHELSEKSVVRSRRAGNSAPLLPLAPGERPRGLVAH